MADLDNVEIFKVKPVVSRLRYLLGQYVKDRERENEEDYQGSFHIFEQDEPLCRALFVTEYACKHLDYEFLMTIINCLVVDYEVRDPVEICNRMISYIKETNGFRDWVAIFPVGFNTFMERKPLSGEFQIGRFVLTEPKKSHSDLNDFLNRKYGYSQLVYEDYVHYSRDNVSNSAFKKNALLSFEMHGSEDAVKFSAITKFNHFRRVFELFTAMSGSPGAIWSQGQRDIHHCFLINKDSGGVELNPLNVRSNIGGNYNERFMEFAKENDFEYFVNLIFYSDDRVFSRIRSALYFFSKAYNGRDHVMNFLSYMIAIESLFARSEKQKIKETLAGFVSRLSYPSHLHEKYSDVVKDLYRQRSDLVHSGKFDLRDDTLDLAKDVAGSTILSCLRLHRDLIAEGKAVDIQSRYFRFLDKMSREESVAASDVSVERPTE
ncbi:HEPN domain-containing protein [Pseudomonas sp. LS-2]|uniref:HEPN domain-containing protein n=1 Tax=Pseudomonas sp. LS-2 TaxID=2315859 RepID=UPI000E749E06|nr:HEPN domain-containing protein [Pseudomonas sp. LS-2]RJX72589.1 hypothetical protein D3M70_30770 [Pseudomonas sp. LS-2]